MENKKAGISIIGFLILVVLGLFALNYFHIDIRSLIKGAETKINGSGDQKITLTPIESKITENWNKYFKKPATHLWEKILKFGDNNKVDLKTFTDMAPQVPVVTTPNQ